MDALTDEWLCELGMEDVDLIHQCHMTSANHSIDEFDFQSFSPGSYQSTLNTAAGRPTETSQAGVRKSNEQEIRKTNSWNSCTTENKTPPNDFRHSDSPSTYLERFNEKLNCSGKSKDHEMVTDEFPNSYLTSYCSDDNPSDKLESRKRTKNSETLSRPPLQAKNHVMAERKRRERLNLKLIALSALIPGLKKMDKASILGDATKYIKQLEERVQTLEGQTKEKIEEGAMISVKRPRLSGDDDSSSCTEDFDENSNKPFPETVVRVSNKNVLVGIHCEKQDGLTTKILSKLEKFNLNVISTSAIPFGSIALDITIIAQMDDEFDMKGKDLVKNLRAAVLKFI